jgi:hypothetical protein
MVGQYGGWCWWGNGQLGGSGLLHGQIGGSKPQLAILAGQYHHNTLIHCRFDAKKMAKGFGFGTMPKPTCTQIIPIISPS